MTDIWPLGDCERFSGDGVDTLAQVVGLPYL